jgi:hypothetical protein
MNAVYGESGACGECRRHHDRLGNAFLAQYFDGIQYAYTDPDTCYAHLGQRLLVQLEDDVPTYIVLTEDARQAAAVDVR